MTRSGASVAHVMARVALLRRRMVAEADRRRRSDSAPDDPFRGLHLDVVALQQVLQRDVMPIADDTEARGAIEAAADATGERGDEMRLRSLASRFALDDLDVELLLVALVADVDPAATVLVAYLHDDVTRRRPSVGLALSLAGRATWDHEARSRLAPGSPLVDAGLIELGDDSQPFLERTVRVADRVVAHLLGGDAPDASMTPLLVDTSAVELGDPEVLAAVMSDATSVVHVTDRSSGTARAFACAALDHLGVEALVVDLSRVGRTGADGLGTIRLVVREARLTGKALVAGPVDALAGDPATVAMQVDALARAGVPVVLHGAGAWDPSWTPIVPLAIAGPTASEDDRRSWWTQALGGDDVAAPVHLRLAPDRVAAAAATARLHAAHRGEPLDPSHLHHGARAQNAVALDRLARRITPAATWDDLVLPDVAESALRELVARARHLDLVLDEWGLGRPSRGRGLSALFAGESGTGKTLAAEVIAGALGLDLYTINLAMVVDKYIGETEKNLERLFDAAEDVNGVLFFDEADALFGKRSDVSDARDRYANVEVAYLLQKMEAYDGIAVLATNLRGNVDEAFTRRLSVIVEFPSPDAPRREAIWRAALGTRVPLSDDVDLAALAACFDLRGGDIASSAAAAAFLAADNGHVVHQEHLLAAVEHEYRKLGRLLPRA